MAIREGRWDCQYCGTKGILGRHKTCPVCATSRPEGTRFYLPADAEVMTSADQIDYAQLGPDWVCEFCRTSNPANQATCQSCFAKRTAAAPIQEVTTYQPGQAPTSGDMSFTETRPAAAAQTGTDSLLDMAGWEDQLGRLPRKIILGTGIILLLLCAIFVLSTGRQFFNRDIDVRVTGYDWQRTIEVEAYRTVTEEDWVLPGDGRLLSQQQEIHHYNPVLAGYETRSREVPEQVFVGNRDYVCGVRDLGNGYFEDVMCSEPIYETRFRTETYQEPIYNQVPIFQTKYTYEIDKWVVDHTETADGRNRDPYWPALNLDENQREGQKTELYAIIFRDDEGDSYRLEFPYPQWTQFGEGENHTLKLNAQGDAVELVN